MVEYKINNTEYSILENIKNKKEFLEVNFKYIREEIGKRVESLVNQVQEMGNGLVEKVKEKEKEALK